MRNPLTRERLLALMHELARTAPRRGVYRVYITGGGTAVYLGWRKASVDADLSADRDEVFRDIQGVKERLKANIEFASPADFVPPLKGSAARHIPIEKIGGVTFFHYDPYMQLLAKITRGFQRDLDDARNFLRSGLVDAQKFKSLIAEIPDSAYSKYPNLSRAGVEKAVEDFLAKPE